MVGITGYGSYIPRFRLKVEEIWSVWVDPTDTAAIIQKRRGLTEKAVLRWDEDAITMAIDAAKSSLEMAGIQSRELQALYFGSCTSPYASGSAVSVIAEGLGSLPELMCADCQFSTRSGSATLTLCQAVVKAEMARYGMAIGSDALSRHVPPNSALEYSASSGAAAFIVGAQKVIAEIEGVYSYTTLTPEFFRLSGERYIKHSAGEEDQYAWGYARHIKQALAGYFKKYSCGVKDFPYIAISQPDGQMALELAAEIGASPEQLQPGLIGNEIGDCGSASPGLSLISILDKAEAGQKILLVSYGFGAGSDVIGLKTTGLLAEVRSKPRTYPALKDQIANRETINYAQYTRQERKLVQEYI
jgi:3-hydroxy-3-methylglutaryl CoA synthase